MKQNKFNDEIISGLIEKDEHPRSDVTIENLSSLKTIFKENGTVTAGNSSGINDGAAGVIMMRRDEAEKKRFRCFSQNSFMGYMRSGSISNGVRSNTISKKALKKQVGRCPI